VSPLVTDLTLAIKFLGAAILTGSVADFLQENYDNCTAILVFFPDLVFLYVMLACDASQQLVQGT
jgi:hypothetical protein